MTTPTTPAPNLGEPTNVRFPQSLVVAAKRAAASDGASSVSEWIRGMVEQEVRRREGKCPACGAPEPGRWTSLRDQITRDAATEQELGDGYGEMGTDAAWDSANKHWGRAEALREVLAAMDRMEAGR